MSSGIVEQVFPEKISLGQRIRTALTFKKKGGLRQHNWVGYLFISPWLIGFFAFVSIAHCGLVCAGLYRL